MSPCACLTSNPHERKESCVGNEGSCPFKLGLGCRRATAQLDQMGLDEGHAGFDLVCGTVLAHLVVFHRVVPSAQHSPHYAHRGERQPTRPKVDIGLDGVGTAGVVNARP